jgi:hypothetical protein
MTIPNTELQPNDVAIILRPKVEADVWTGVYDVMISGFGPITIKPEDMDSMIGVAVLLASVIPLMDEDEDIASIIHTYCSKHYSDMVDEISYDEKHDSFAPVTVGTPGDLSVDTKTHGGVH